jgi:chromosomal replication initiator protein
MQQLQGDAIASESDVRVLWDAALDIIKGELNAVTFKTWFQAAEPLGIDAGAVVVGAPNSWGRDWLESRYSGLLSSTLSEVSGQPLTVRFTVSGEDEVRIQEPLAEEPPVPSVPQAGPVAAQRPVGAGLDGRFTFDSFVVGDSNEFAYTTALAVAEAPGHKYNPLFIYGGVGLGKTHLLQAIGHYARVHYPHLKVKYVDTQQLVDEFTRDVRQEGGMEGFRRRYRDNDLLLVDDVQFLQGKKETQEEFFRTFNVIVNAGGQIVLSSDRPPRELDQLPDRLVSRFSQGVPADINPPELETRVAILRKKVESEGVPVPEEVLTFIAERVSSNVRELEGALLRVKAWGDLSKSPIDLELARKVLKDVLPERSVRPIPIAVIKQEVCKFYGLSMADLVGNKRSQAIVYPRQVAMYLSREMTDLSLPRIGAEFGGRDHSTVLHATNKITKMLSDQREVYSQVQTLTNLIRQKV